MRQRTSCFIALCLIAIPFYAQNEKEWTLDDCINYALEKNIQLQQDKISLQESEIEVKTAKADLFPSLSFGTGHNLINRPYQEQSATVSGTEIISSNNKTTYNGNYSLNAQWTLWNGGQRLNNLKQQKTNRDIAQLTVAETQNMLQEEITQLFIQILYAKESIDINENTLEISKATYERGKQLFEEGSISKADLAQLEAQVSNDEYQVVNTTGNTEITVMAGTDTTMQVVVEKKDVPVVTKTVGVNYWDVKNDVQAGEGEVTVAADANNVNTSTLTDIPEGYELVSTGDVEINDGWIWVEVKPVATTQEIGVNYWDVENDVQAGEGKVTVAADAYNVNTSVLTDIPEGYELASTGDIKINDGWIYVEVRPAAEKTVEIGVNYWDEDNNNQAGEGKVTVDAGANNVNTSALTDVPEGYEISRTGDVQINDGWIFVEVRPAAEETVEIGVNYWDVENNKQAGEGKVTVDADAYNVNTSALTDIPEGYELVNVGDVTINDGWIYVEVRPVKAESTIIHVTFKSEGGKDLGGGDFFVDADGDGVFNYSELTLPEGYELIETGDTFVDTDKTYEITLHKTNPGTIINVVYVDENGNNVGGGDYFVDMDDDGIANFSELDVPEGYKLVVTGDFFVADYTGQTNEIKVEKIQKGTIINVVFEDRQGNNLGGGDYLVDEDGDGVANYSELDLPAGYKLIETGDFFVKDAADGMTVVLDRDGSAIIHVVFKSEGGKNLGGGDYFVDEDGDGVFNYSELDLPVGYELIVTGDEFVDTDKTYEITLHKINAGTIINVVFVDEEGNNLGGGDYFVDMDDDGIANFSELTLPEGYELIVTGDFFVDEYVGHSNTIVLKKIEVIRDASLRVTFETTDGKKVWATKMMTKEGVEGEDVVFSLGEDFHLPLFFKLAEGVDQITDITIPAGSVGGHTMIVEPIFDVRLPKLQLHLKQ